jgi:hypothetical protein
VIGLGEYIAGERGRVLLVSRGPSRVHAMAWSDEFDSTASVNEGCLDVPGIVDFAFFADVERFDAAKPAHDRIRWFVCPSQMHRKEGPRTPPLTPQGVGVPRRRLLTYPYELVGVDPHSIGEAVAAGRVCLCYTAVAAVHVLSMLGYREIYCIGTEDAEGGANDPAYLPALRALDALAESLLWMRRVRVKFWRPGGERGVWA